jgi:hypothetical protein
MNNPPAALETSKTEGEPLLLGVKRLGIAHDRHEAECSEAVSSRNLAGDDKEDRDSNLPTN